MTYPARAFLKYEETREDVLQRIQATRDAAVSGPVPRIRLIRFMGNLSRALDVLDVAAATPGVVQYVRDQFGDQGRDVAAQFTATRGALASLRDWIETNFPKQGAAWLDNAGYDLYGNSQPAQFTQAQLTQPGGFADLCDATILALQ